MASFITSVGSDFQQYYAQQAAYQSQYYGGYYGMPGGYDGPPSKPQYNFNYLYEGDSIFLKDCKLMPRGFDYLTGKILKDITPKAKGGEKKVKRMPRLWKWLIVYIPVTVLVWDVVNNANRIALWLVTQLPHR